MRIYSIALFLLATALVTGCGKDDKKTTTASGGQVEELPAPAGTSGGVTGMPGRPGPGPIGPPVTEQPAVPLDENGNPLPPESLEGTSATEPTPEDALAVIRDYYGAINSGDFGRAHALWFDGGRASGQSLHQFAAGFAETTGVSVEMQAPSEIDAAAGSRYVEVPVTITATHRDGSQHRHTGKFVLRRAVVDGATAEQRAWRIASAELGETAP